MVATLLRIQCDLTCLRENTLAVAARCFRERSSSTRSGSGGDSEIGGGGGGSSLKGGPASPGETAARAAAVGGGGGNKEGTVDSDVDASMSCTADAGGGGAAAAATTVAATGGAGGGGGVDVTFGGAKWEVMRVMPDANGYIKEIGEWAKLWTQTEVGVWGTTAGLMVPVVRVHGLRDAFGAFICDLADMVNQQ